MLPASSPTLAQGSPYTSRVLKIRYLLSFCGTVLNMRNLTRYQQETNKIAAPSSRQPSVNEEGPAIASNQDAAPLLQQTSVKRQATLRKKLQRSLRDSLLRTKNGLVVLHQAWSALRHIQRIVKARRMTKMLLCRSILLHVV